MSNSRDFIGEIDYGGEGGIEGVVVEAEVTVGGRWYASCFQRGFTIRRNRQCLCEV
jgi:hypothetical protein